MSDAARAADNFRVRFSSETPGDRMSRTGRRVVLHNHKNPCPAGRQLKNWSVARLGADVAPRPELKRLCYECDFPIDRQELANALLRTPARYRNDPPYRAGPGAGQP